MRSFVIVGQRALASSSFSLLDLPGTSGRLDVLVRCIRAALLLSHGKRTDTRLYLVLLGGEHAPLTLRISGEKATFLRPDERALGTLVKKVLTAFETMHDAGGENGFVDVRQGVAASRVGLSGVLDDVPDAELYVLDSAGADLRTSTPASGSALFVIGDHLGLDAEAQRLLDARGAMKVSIGPVVVHAEDVVTLVHNELDRRDSDARTGPAHLMLEG